MTAPTDRETFERVAAHLLAQGRRATDGENCRYRWRNPDGTTLRCAVGCLVPDELYDPCMERQSVGGRVVRETLVRAGVLPPEHAPDWRAMDMLRCLQQLHDRVDPARWADFLASMRRDLFTEDGLWTGSSYLPGPWPGCP